MILSVGQLSFRPTWDVRPRVCDSRMSTFFQLYTRIGLRNDRRLKIRCFVL